MFFGPNGQGEALPGIRSSEMATDKDEGPAIEVVAENLAIPWEVEFLSDGSLLVTERPGELVRIFPDSRESVTIDGVEHVGEGGLLGMALHPDYQRNHWLYLYFTTNTGNGLTNRIERYVFDEDNNSLSGKVVIIEGIPGAQFHDGGRIAFGPDDLLYVATGDAGDQNSAQDTTSLAGKILRLNDDGSPADGNPFGNEVYSYGHRNPQGLAWDSEGRLWSSEHGPSGLQTGNDEINLIVAGGNYGWPTIKGQQTREGMISPVIESGSTTTWAPGDAAVVGETVFFAGLRGVSLYSAEINGEQLTNLTSHLTGEYGRLRSVVTDLSGEWLYLTTSNTDGRGDPAENDDRLIRVRVSLFFSKK